MVKVIGGVKVGPALQAIADRLTNAARVEVGFPEGSTYPDGTSLPMVAAINEFGRPSVGQPPRSFMRATVAKHSGEWAPAAATVLKATNYDAHKTLEQIGQAIQGQVINEIVTLTSPPLAPSTIEKKGFSKPLINKGVMAGSVSVNVKD